MFYGKSSEGPPPSSSSSQGVGRGGRNERFDQMLKQQQLIEQKKKEIQARLEAEAAATLGVAGSSATASSSSTSQREEEELPKPALQLSFNNDGSFLERFKKMQEEAARKKKEEEDAARIKIKSERIEYDDYGNPIRDRPLIKFFRPEDVGVTRHDAPPPPPPPPPRHGGDIKPYLNLQFSSNECGNNDVLPPPPPPPGGPLGAQKMYGFPPPPVKALAARIAEEGDYVEDHIRMQHQGDPLIWFLNKPESAEYKTFRALITEIRSDLRTHMYNEAPPPPPPPIIVKQEPRIKSEPVSPPQFVNPIPAISIKQEPGIKVEFPSQAHSNSPPVASSYSNFVKSEASSSSPSSSGIKREASISDGEESEMDRREKRRRSRWGPQASDVPPVGVVAIPAVGQSVVPVIAGVSGFGMNLMNMPLMPMDASTSLSKITRANPQLLAYARQAYGRIDLDEDEWKRCEEAYKMNLMFQDIARKKVQDEKLAQAGKFKHDYDSDEETEGGTWEHRLRQKEMEKTKDWAQDLTKKAHGKHHIGDFLPPDELSKFMEKYKAVKEGKRLDESDYEEFKIQQDSIGFKMLQKMGWSAGEGLGTAKQGITAPIDKGNVAVENQGLGVEKPGDLTEDDDEYAAYRKRMMLAYRFRPNPLNNPRRAYY